MKWIITIPAILLFALAGCGKDKQSTNELIIVDVTKNYPEKELILQDFMDVEYIPLETNDEFVTQGKVMAIGAEVILITNWANDGNLFVFNRKTGKALKKINRKGQGGEEMQGQAHQLGEEIGDQGDIDPRVYVQQYPAPYEVHG
jgi:hypothetical protein